jgi:RNA polymerase sigma-70 factor (ECF subfamily)
MPLEGPVVQAIHAPETRRTLLALANRLMKNRSDAEDCLQEAFIAALRFSEHCDDPSGWLRRIVQNACRMELRARRRIRRGAGARHLEFEDHHAPTSTLDPERAALDREMLAAVVSALNELDAEDVRLLDRHVFDDVSTRDLAEEWSLAREAVKSRIFRARRKVLSTVESAR